MLIKFNPFSPRVKFFHTNPLTFKKKNLTVFKCLRFSETFTEVGGIVESTTYQVALRGLHGWQEERGWVAAKGDRSEWTRGLGCASGIWCTWTSLSWSLEEPQPTGSLAHCWQGLGWWYWSDQGLRASEIRMYTEHHDRCFNAAWADLLLVITPCS